MMMADPDPALSADPDPAQSAEKNTDPQGSSSSTSGRSRQPYRHRHTRLYLTDPEEKKKRTAELNREACRLYRERKKRYRIELRDQLQQEERKNQQYTSLQDKLKKIKDNEDGEK